MERGTHVGQRVHLCRNAPFFRARRVRVPATYTRFGPWVKYVSRFSGDRQLIGIRCVIKVEPLEPDLLREKCPRVCNACPGAGFSSPISFPRSLSARSATRSIASRFQFNARFHRYWSRPPSLSPTDQIFREKPTRRRIIQTFRLALTRASSSSLRGRRPSFRTFAVINTRPFRRRVPSFRLRVAKCIPDASPISRIKTRGLLTPR